MRDPFGKTAARRDDETGVGRRLLKILRPPRQQGALSVCALCRLRREPEQTERTVTMMGKVRVDAHPAISAAIQTGKFVPDVRRDAIEAEPAGAL